MMLFTTVSMNQGDANVFFEEHNTAPLQVEYQAFCTASIAAVFDAVADHERFCNAVTELKQITLFRSEQGLIRRCDFGNDMIVDQQIVLCQSPSVFAYAITTPNPLGLRQHRTIVTCTPREGGTLVVWQHYFEHDDLPAMIAMLERMVMQIFDGLIKQFGGRIVV